MKIVTTPKCTFIIDERDRSPMEICGGKEEHGLYAKIEELSANGKTAHIVRPAYDWNGNLLFYYRLLSYVDGQRSSAFDSLVKFDISEELQ